MKLRRLTDEGLNELSTFLDALTSPTPDSYPQYLLTTSGVSEPVSEVIEVEAVRVTTRFDLAEYLHAQFEAELEAINLRDVGLWSWLALLFFEQLCPPNSKGIRKPGERARWIPAITDYKKYYRHLVAGPYRVYGAHRDNPKRALAVLCGPVSKPGELAEQLTSRIEIVTNAGIMETARRLYMEESTAKPKRGAAGSGPGSVRRLVDVLIQFDLTYDLYSMSPDDLMGLLPEEFDQFREA